MEIVWATRRNNPLVFTDPTGRNCVYNRSDGTWVDDGQGKPCNRVDYSPTVVEVKAEKPAGVSAEFKAFVINTVIGAINAPDDYFEGLLGLRANEHIDYGQGGAAFTGAVIGGMVSGPSGKTGQTLSLSRKALKRIKFKHQSGRLPGKSLFDTSLADDDLSTLLTSAGNSPGTLQPNGLVSRTIDAGKSHWR